MSTFINSIVKSMSSQRRLFCESIFSDDLDTQLINDVIDKLVELGVDAQSLYDMDIEYEIVNYAENHPTDDAGQIAKYIKDTVVDNNGCVSESDDFKVTVGELFGADSESTMENIAKMFNCTVEDVDDDFDVEMSDVVREKFHDMVHTELEEMDPDEVLDRKSLSKILDNQYDWVVGTIMKTL